MEAAASKIQKKLAQYFLWVTIAVVSLAAIFFIVCLNVMEMTDPHPRGRSEIQMKEFMKALDFYRLDYGRYPSTAQGLQVLTQAKKGSQEPYVREIPLDHWGRPYIYTANGDNYELICYGADGKSGGFRYNADIVFSSFRKK